MGGKSPSLGATPHSEQRAYLSYSKVIEGIAREVPWQRPQDFEVSQGKILIDLEKVLNSPKALNKRAEAVFYAERKLRRLRFTLPRPED